MPSTRKKVKVIGQQEYINPRTGEPELFNVVNIEERDANFHKIWLGHIIQALDVIGNQKIKVLNFILENLNKENQLIMTQRKIAEKAQVGINTVIDTMKALQEADFLVKINSGAYQVNPNILFKGGKNDRLRVLFDYTNVQAEVAATTSKSEEEQLEALGQTTISDAVQETTASVDPVPVPEEKLNLGICHICGANLVQRTRNDDGKKFPGCPNWRRDDHKIKMKKAN